MKVTGDSPGSWLLGWLGLPEMIGFFEELRVRGSPEG